MQTFSFTGFCVTPAVSTTDTEGVGMVLSDHLRQVSALQGVNGNELKTVRTYPRAMFTVYRTGELFVQTRKPIRYSVNTSPIRDSPL